MLQMKMEILLLEDGGATKMVNFNKLQWTDSGMQLVYHEIVDMTVGKER